MKVEESVPIEDGKYNGTIKDVVEVIEPYEYTEFVIGFEIEDRKIDLQFGCPSKILLDKKTGKPTSKLATTLDEFGYPVKVGEEITIPSLKKHFVGIKVSSLITNKKTNRGTFAQVMTMIPRLSKK
jgi:hypothetical protein